MRFVPCQGKLTYKGPEDISQDSIAERSERIGFVLQNPNQMISHYLILMKWLLVYVCEGLKKLRLKSVFNEGLEDLWPPTVFVNGLFLRFPLVRKSA